MNDATLELVEKYLEPVALTLLAMNQREFARPVLDIVGEAKQNPYLALHHLLMNSIRDIHNSNEFELNKDLEQLEELPFNEEYNPQFYKNLAAFKRAVEEGSI